MYAIRSYYAVKFSRICNANDRILDLTAISLGHDRRIRKQETVKRLIKAVLDTLYEHDLPTLTQNGSF